MTTATPNKAKSSDGASSPAPTKSTDDLAYKKAIGRIARKLSDLATRSETLAWEHAEAAHFSMKELEREFDKPKVRFYEDLAAAHPWASGTIKKAIIITGKLDTMGVPEVFTAPATGYTQVDAILFAGKLSKDQIGSLLVKVYKHDKKKPDERYTVQAVRGMIEALIPPEEVERKWLKGTDVWTFGDYDERFGTAGFVGRVPGQAFQNLIHRFSGGAIRFLSVGCGGGTALDVCKNDMNKLVGTQYRGVDIVLSDRVKKFHSDHAIQMDCTKPIQHWDKVCEEEWADMVVVTLPFFEFTKAARTNEKSDLGNEIDPVEWLGLMGQAIAGAYSRLNTHGILVVHTHSTAEFERGEPVPDMDWNVVRIIQEHTKFFLAKIVLQVAKKRSPSSPEDQPWVTPQAEYLHVYKKI